MGCALKLSDDMTLVWAGGTSLAPGSILSQRYLSTSCKSSFVRSTRQPGGMLRA